MCHGVEGRNPRPGYAPMVGNHSWPTIDSPKTITYYEHATTIFDITRRGMPYQTPRTLTNDEVYALTAYLLAHEQADRPERRDEQGDAAEGEHAEQGQVHHPLPGREI